MASKGYKMAELKLTFDVNKLKIVPIDTVIPNDWNPKNRETSMESFNEVKKSLEIHGFRQPVIVREITKNQYEIIDGEQRYTAAKQLGFTEVVIYNEGKKTREEAIELTIAYQTQVPFVRSQLAELVSQAVGRGARLPYSEAKTQDLLNLMQFDWDSYAGTDLELTNEHDESDIENFSVTATQLDQIKQLIKDTKPKLSNDEKAEKRARVTTQEKIFITKAQYTIIDQAIQAILPDANNSKGRALELICSDFLAGYNHQE